MSFQFLRPEWLFMLLPLTGLMWLYWHRRFLSRNWHSVIDPKLLPHLVTGKKGRGAGIYLILFSIIGTLIVIALSGPVWKKLPLPVYQQQSSLVIALDLSNSMNTTDIKPSRLARARLKMMDLLKTRKEGQTALLAYAATAYTVTPLTDDINTIQALVSSLSSEIMPAQGSRADLAVEKAVELFANAGIGRGDILIITDGIHAKSLSRIRDMDIDRYRISILAVGTAEGAPIPIRGGGFLKDSSGSIVIPKTDHGLLRSAAYSLGGMYSALSMDDSDLTLFDGLFNQTMTAEHEQTDFKADRWQEEGPWLLLLVTPLTALFFRRGVILSILLVLFLLPASNSLFAADGWWDKAWQNSDQRGQKLLNAGDADKAARLFTRQDWKAAALYRSGQYEQALQQLEALESHDALYNRGNTLAKMGRLQEALESYDDLLKKQPDHEDAHYNRELVEQALKQQQKQQQDNQQEGDEQNQSDQENQNEQNSDQQSADQSADDPSSRSEQNGDHSEQQNSSAEQAEEDERDSSMQENSTEQQDDDQAAQNQQQAEANENEMQDGQPTPIEQEVEENLSKQAEAQWLRRIPDDPGGLLRNKFKYQYGRQQQSTVEQEQW